MEIAPQSGPSNDDTMGELCAANAAAQIEAGVMPENAETDDALRFVAVQLLDPTSGRPLKTWLFRNQAEITIGRSPDRDVELSDPYVSRHHASLTYLDRKWRLLALGRNGVVVAADLITEYAITGEVSFRLGMEGPTMRFCTHAEKVEGGATISCDTLPEPLIQLDERKLQSTVGEIANGDYFQTLQQRAKLMRHNRRSD